MSRTDPEPPAPAGPPAPTGPPGPPPGPPSGPRPGPPSDGTARPSSRRDARAQVRRAARGRNRSAGLALALLVPVCLVYLWFPQDSDGVLFELGADRMAQGAVFYRDLWDVKQPGIYWIYQAGAALGVGVVGPRLFEIAGVLVGGVLVWQLAGRWRVQPFVRIVAPLLVMGGYLLMTHRGGVLAIEGLCTPLLVAVVAGAWPADPAGGPPRPVRGWVMAGVAVGLVGVLKVIYLPLPLTILLGALLASRTSVGRRILLLGSALVAASVPVGLAIGYFAVHSILDLAWTTTIRVPLEAVGGEGLDAGFKNWYEIFIELSTLLGVLALIGVAGARRRGTVLREATLVAVVLEAGVLALEQYPTPYRPLVLVAPIGLIAMVGADTVWRRATAARRPRAGTALVLAVAAVLALPLARGPQRLIFAAADIPSWGLGRAERNARDAVLIDYYPALDAEPVRGQVEPADAIYVFGQPQLYQELGAREAVEITGWASTLMPDRVWRERDRELVRSRPRLIFVQDDVVDEVRAGSPGLVAMLATDYTELARTRLGVWYRTDRPGEPSGIPGDNRIGETAARADRVGSGAAPR